MGNNKQLWKIMIGAVEEYVLQNTKKRMNAGELKAERIEEHDMLNWVKANRKVLNAGKMKTDRVEKLTIVDFRHDSTMIKRAYHCARCSESLENFWK